MRLPQPGEQGREGQPAVFHLVVFPAGSPEIPVEVNAVGNGGHEGDGGAGGPELVVVFGDAGVGVTAGVGGVVPGAIVVHGPVHELEVRVGADIVEIEEVGQAHAAEAEVDAPGGNLRGEGERRPGGVGEVGAQADNLMEFDPGDIGDGAEAWVAHNVEVGEAGQAERLGETTAAGGLEVEEEVGGVVGVAVEFQAGEEGTQQGSFVLAAAEERVFVLIRRVEAGVGLEDDVGLPRDQVWHAVGMRENGDGCGVGGVGRAGFASALLRGSGHNAAQRQQEVNKAAEAHGVSHYDALPS